MNRRDFIKLMGIASASLALSACGPVYDRLAGGEPTIEDWPTLNAGDFLRLSRLTFGPTAGERDHFSKIGLGAFIEEQLAYESLDNKPADLRLRDFGTLDLKANELYEYGSKLFDDLDKVPVPSELRQATLIRQVYSPRQLYEVMVEFWSDHFNISVDKGDCWYLKTVDDREVIRKHALGNFHELLNASAHSPAMLVYLDNQANDKSHPNENYAREVMELHTLSVQGGYSQKDVMELARCLTGWTVKQNFWLGEFKFDEELHDEGNKIVLGTTITPSGEAEAEGVIEVLARHPATAHFIATKLARRFIADDPPADLVEKAAQKFLETDGDIKAVLRVILLEGLPVAQPKYKRPVNYVVSALRMLNVYYGDGKGFSQPSRPVIEALSRMGQPVFGWPTPDGFPDVAARWQGNLMPRWQFALALARNELDGVTVDIPALLKAANITEPTQGVDQLSTLLLGAPLDTAARDSLIATLKAKGADDESLAQIVTAGLLASPAFQWR